MKLTINCPSWDNELLAGAKIRLDKLYNQAVEYDIVPISLKEIIISENYIEDYNRISGEFGLKQKISFEYEYVSAGKMCYNKHNENECIMLIPANVFIGDDIVDVVNTLLLESLADEFLPKEILDTNTYYYNTPISEIAKVFWSGIFSITYSTLRMDFNSKTESQPYLKPDSILAPFKRNVKKLHLTHQQDQKFEQCVIEYYSVLQKFLQNFTRICLYKIDYSDFEEFSDVLAYFRNNVFQESSKIIRGESFSLDFLEKTIIDISKLCYFEIDSTNNEVSVSENPKKLFPKIVDTHERIVGFIDILGFSNLIQEYDNRNDIGLLKELKEALDFAISEMNKQFQYLDNFLEVKLFSDCLSISSPYFDNDTDFAFQFSIVMFGLKVYQNYLLTHGYLVRGGVTIGSYYSNENMIFSGALVEAVNFEKYGSTKKVESKLKPPRILVSPKIIEKLNTSTIHKNISMYYEDGLIQDEDDEIFINPLYNLSTSRNTFNDVLNDLKNSEFEESVKIGEILSEPINFLSSLVPPESELIISTQHIEKMNHKISKYSDSSFVSKYVWMKELVEWHYKLKQNSKFNYYKVKFNKIVDSWD